MKTITTSFSNTTKFLSSCLQSWFASRLEKDDNIEFQQTIPFTVTKNKTLTDLSFIGKEYTIFFEIFINKLPTTNNFVNVLLLTKTNCNGASPRYPGIWVKKFNGILSKFHITQDMNGNWNDAKDIPVPAANKWIKIEVSQTKIGEKVKVLLLYCNHIFFRQHAASIYGFVR